MRQFQGYVRSDSCDKDHTRAQSRKLSPDLWGRKVLPEKLTLKLRHVQGVGKMEFKREEVGEELVNRQEHVAGLSRN